MAGRMAQWLRPEYQARITHLEGELRQHMEAYSQVFEEMTRIKTEAERKHHHQVKRITALQTENAKLKENNAWLESRIISTKMSTDPFKPEDYYVGKIKQLSLGIEQWAVRVARESVLQPASINAEVLSILSSLGSEGKDTADLLKKSEAVIKGLELPATQIGFIRHLFALTLYHFVLSPYIPCMTPEISGYMWTLEDSILLNGLLPRWTNLMF
jgi:hypothetical protein